MHVPPISGTTELGQLVPQSATCLLVFTQHHLLIVTHVEPLLADELLKTPAPLALFHRQCVEWGSDELARVEIWQTVGGWVGGVQLEDVLRTNKGLMGQLQGTPPQSGAIQKDRSATYLLHPS